MDTKTSKQEPPKVYSVSNSSPSFASFPIRAPPTIDSDSEDFLSSNGKKFSTSSYGSDYSGYLTGEDEYETSSDRPHVSDPDNEILEQSSVGGVYDDVPRPFVKNQDDEMSEGSSFSEEFAVSRPYEMDPDDEFVIESSHVEEFDVSRPAVKNPDDEIVERSGLVEEFGVSRPFLKIPDKEIVEEVGSVNEFDVSKDKSSHVEPAVIDVGRLSPPKLGVPIALLSRDSDDDSSGGEVEEDDFLVRARIPSAGIVENVISAPKIKVLAIEEGEDDELQIENVVSDEVTNVILSSNKEKVNAEKDSISDKDANGNLGYDEETGTAGTCSVNHFNAAEAVKMEGLELNETTTAACSVSSNDSEDFLVEDIQAVLKAKLLSQSDDGDMVERTSADFGDISSIKLDLMTQVAQSNFLECRPKIPEVDIDVGSGTVYANNDNLEIHSAASSEGVICRPGTEGEIMHKEVEHICERGSDSHAYVIHDDNNTLEPMPSLNANSDSELKVDDKYEAGVSEKLTEGMGSSLLDDGAEDLIDGDSETMMQRGEDPHDSVSSDNTLNPVPSPCFIADIELKVNDRGDAEFPEKLPEEVESSLSNDNAEGLIFGDLRTMMQISERAVDLHDAESYNNTSEPVVKVENKDEADFVPAKLAKEVEGLCLDDNVEGLVFGDSEAMMQIVGELEQKFKHTLSGEEIRHKNFQEEVDDVGESKGKEMLDSTALDALLKDVVGSDGVSSTFSSVKPSPDPTSSYVFIRSELSASDRCDTKEIVGEEEEKKLGELQQIQVKFLRLVQRLGLSAEDSIPAQVLRRLVLASGRLSSESFSLESAMKVAVEVDAAGKSELNFCLNILVIGKTGVGKSATINSIFGQTKALTNAFYPATTTVKEIMGKINGVEVRVLDTPGFRTSLSDQSFNRKVMASIKRSTQKCHPDVVLYVDRVDMQTKDFTDLPLLRMITSTLGPSVWHNSVIVLTHAASTLPDGLFGSPLSYEMLVSQRSRAIQQMISYAVGDMLMVNPVVPVENHTSYKKNGTGQLLLPDGQSWIPQLLLLCCSTKILFELNSLIKPLESVDRSKLLHSPGRLLPLPYLVTSLLQSFSHPKFNRDQNCESFDSDTELGPSTDFDQEDEDEYDQLPPFKSLSAVQISKLSKGQKKAYFDEFAYRVKLLKKKQWREHVKRFKEMEKNRKVGADIGEDGDQDDRGPAEITVPLPDMAIPLSFDGNDPSYRYRFLEPSSRLLARPVLDAHGWDHDIGYDSVSLKQILEIADCFPAEISVQMTKDKKEFNVNMDSAVSAKHGLNGSTMGGLDIQTMGEQIAYIVKGETRLKNFKVNETAAGLSITLLGKNVVSGFKVEDRVAVGKRLVLVGSTGITRSQGDNAYGIKLEGHIREKDFPIGQDQSTWGLTLVRWRGDFVWVCNFQSEFSLGRNSKMSFNAGLNNMGNGQISVRINSLEQLKVAILGFLPIANTICKHVFPQFSERYLNV